jgi:hypothetical protein
MPTTPLGGDEPISPPVQEAAAAGPTGPTRSERRWCWSPPAPRVVPDLPVRSRVTRELARGSKCPSGLIHRLVPRTPISRSVTSRSVKPGVVAISTPIRSRRVGGEFSGHLVPPVAKLVCSGEREHRDWPSMISSTPHRQCWLTVTDDLTAIAVVSPGRPRSGRRGPTPARSPSRPESPQYLC